MPDVVVRVYLYALIIGCVLGPILWMIVWLVKPERRRSLVRAKSLLREMFFLITGLIGFYIFSLRLLNNWIIMAGISVMLILSVYATEAIGILLSRRFGNNDAT
jgi:hypothetical protein